MLDLHWLRYYHKECSHKNESDSCSYLNVRNVYILIAFRLNLIQRGWNCCHSSCPVGSGITWDSMSAVKPTYAVFVFSYGWKLRKSNPLYIRYINEPVRISYNLWTHLIINKVHIFIKILNSQLRSNSLIFQKVANPLFIILYDVSWNDGLCRVEAISSQSGAFIIICNSYFMKILHCCREKL